MRVFSTTAGLRCYLDERQAHPSRAIPEGAPDSLDTLPVRVGLVPTMGALHEGHLSLIRRARQETDVVVVSIFVNPLQFGPHEDFQRYPRTLDADQALCEQAGVDVIFAPTAAEFYQTSNDPGDFDNKARLTQVIPPRSLISGLCGRFRPGHFEGVATVVVKLLNTVQPDVAYFGQKDAQQLAVLRRVIADLNLPVQIQGCPIVRETSGLALSSRNQYLSPEERSQATVLYRSLQRAQHVVQSGVVQCAALIQSVELELATVESVTPEYVELVHPDTLIPLEQIEDVGLLAIAARIGSTRLIDNLVLRHRQPILAIDGPAGAGKTTVVREVARRLGLLYLDTGAMYRAVTWLVLHSGIAVQDQAAIAELVSRCDLDISRDPTHFQIWINGHDVTQVIRNLDVTAHVSAISAHPTVRACLVQQQQQLGRQGGIVMDGRDIGTNVFPDAELKIFLTASVQERARRRQQDLKNQGRAEVSLEELERTIYERDWKDSTRRVSPLRQAVDAIEIQTDGLTIEDVVAQIVALYHERLHEPQLVKG